jgi:hypothetical protein
MTREVRSNYHRFRRAGWRADEAIRAARILARWDEAEGEGWVRLQAIPDEDWTIKDNGCSCGDPACRRRERDAFERHGAWGVVGEYGIDIPEPSGPLAGCLTETRWHHADSCWGFVGFDVLNPLENPYVVDIMAETLEALDA